jgi:hypothetical protein
MVLRNEIDRLKARICSRWLFVYSKRDGHDFICKFWYQFQSLQSDHSCLLEGSL